MSEFKFSCPACGQRIAYDTTHAGTEIACPICQAPIMVPKEAAGSGAASLRTDVTPAWAGYNATTTEPTPRVQRTSGLAIASLICSLSSLITCVGCLPGIICGHLAKSRIRRNPLLKGNGLATAGLAIGYAILTLEVGTVAIGICFFFSRSEAVLRKCPASTGYK